jgi:predicted RNase H-like HicB family nuclease
MMISMSLQEEPPEQTITLKERADYWVAIHEETGVGTQAPTRGVALDELDEAVALHTTDATEPVEDEDAHLRELGIDPDEIDKEQPLLAFMQG